MFFRVKSLKALNQIREKNKKTILNRIHQYEFYKNKSIQGWDDLPIIDKKIYVSQFEDFNLLKMPLAEAYLFGEKLERTENYLKRKKGYTIGLSTGTSGRRSAFILSSREVGTWAGTIIAKVLGWYHQAKC